MDAYNRWLAEYCSAHRERLLGVGQTPVRSPADGIEDLRRIRALGLRGVMLPNRPGQADWDSPLYDEFFEAAIEVGLPLSFHILTDPLDAFPRRGPVMNFAVGIIRSNQDLLSLLIRPHDGWECFACERYCRGTACQRLVRWTTPCSSVQR
jgi:uncharacterized protein